MTDRPQLHFYDLGSGVTAFSTTRHGGCSEGRHASMNINPYCGDSPEATARNLRLLAEELGVEPGRIVLPHQTHQTDVRLISEEFFRLPGNIQTMVLNGVDGVMTQLTGVCVGVSTADCVPVLLYDPRHRAVAAVHAGWRGTAKRIVQKSVMEMAAAFGTEASDVKAVIGPCISLDAFEVGDEVYDEFQKALFPMEKIAQRREKWHIDLPLCNRLQLEAAGIPAQNIASCGICTYHSEADFFSARRLGTESGRIYTGIIVRT